MILGLACVSTVVLMILPGPNREGMVFWTYNRVHKDVYKTGIASWNQKAMKQTSGGPTVPVDMAIVDINAQTRRILAAFWSGIPVADFVEIESGFVGQYFAGPLEDIGFVDMTDRIEAEGLFEKMVPQAFSMWSSRGRVFGLPHDVHPVVLGYRADIFEAEGIDVEQIETWDDFVRVTKPLVKDLNGDGSPDRYPLSMWFTEKDQITALLLQGDGGLFDAAGKPILNSPENARVISSIVGWCGGPNRIATEAKEFDHSGNQKRVDGSVLSCIMPDWLGGVYKVDLPQMAGKWRVMPLPAWTPGGRRTSVWGGTMLAIAKTTSDVEQAWAFAKELYLSRDLAEHLFKNNSIVSPVRAMWDEPFYQEPDPYFGGQVTGEVFISLLDDVPMRFSSPYQRQAVARVVDVVGKLRDFAEDHDDWSVEFLTPEAHRLLAKAQVRVENDLARNIFLSDGDEQAAADALKVVE